MKIIDLSQAQQLELMERFHLEPSEFMDRLAHAEAEGMTECQFIEELAVEYMEYMNGYDAACQYEQGWHAYD